jgi:hypothetical protein
MPERLLVGHDRTPSEAREVADKTLGAVRKARSISHRVLSPEHTGGRTGSAKLNCHSDVIPTRHVRVREKGRLRDAARAVCGHDRGGVKRRHDVEATDHPPFCGVPWSAGRDRSGAPDPESEGLLGAYGTNPDRATDLLDASQSQN